MENLKAVFARSLADKSPSEDDLYELYVERVINELFHGDLGAMENFTEVTSRGLSEAQILAALPTRRPGYSGPGMVSRQPGVPRSVDQFPC